MFAGGPRPEGEQRARRLHPALGAGEPLTPPRAPSEDGWGRRGVSVSPPIGRPGRNAEGGGRPLTSARAALPAIEADPQAGGTARPNTGP